VTSELHEQREARRSRINSSIPEFEDRRRALAGWCLSSRVGIGLHTVAITMPELIMDT
jgi:hypothetical protein